MMNKCHINFIATLYSRFTSNKTVVNYCKKICSLGKKIMPDGNFHNQMHKLTFIINLLYNSDYLSSQV